MSIRTIIANKKNVESRLTTSFESVFLVAVDLLQVCGLHDIFKTSGKKIERDVCGDPLCCVRVHVFSRTFILNNNFHGCSRRSTTKHLRKLTFNLIFSPDIINDIHRLSIVEIIIEKVPNCGKDVANLIARFAM